MTAALPPSPAVRRLLALVLLCCAGLLPASEVAAAGGDARLVVWNRELAVFRAPIGFASVQERARSAVARFAKLPDEALDATVEARPAKVGELNGVMLYAGPDFLFAIDGHDLDDASGETMAVAGQRAVDRVRELFAARREAGRGGVLMHGLLTAGLCVVALGAALLVLGLLRRRLDARLHPGVFARLPPVLGLDLRGMVLGATRAVLHLPFIAGSLVALYFALEVGFAAFPYTRPWAQALGDWLWGVVALLAGGVVGALPGLFIVLVILLLTRTATRALSSFFTGVEEGRLQIGWMQPETARATRRIAVVLLWLFAITVSYPYMPGSSSEAFKGVSVFAGLVLTLGSTGMVNQVMSGLVVVYARSMRPGDIVQVGETVGTVVDLGLLSTRVRTPRQEEVSIPNAVLVGSAVTNFSRHDDQGMVLTATVTIGYDTPWRQVHDLLALAAGRTAGIRAAPTPYVVQKALDDFYVAYELRARLERAEERFAAQSALHGHILDLFAEHGVQIMSPHFTEQPDQPVLPPKPA